MLETIFSNLISGFLLEIFKKKDNNKKIALPISILNETLEIDKSTKQSIPEYNIRILEAIKLLNVNKRDPMLNGASIAEDLSIESISLIEDIINGSIMPSSSMLSCFAEKYEIDLDWLKTGCNTPFHKHCLTYTWAENAIQIYKEYKPKTVYIFTADVKEHFTAIAYQKTHYDFRIIHCESNWHLSSNGIGGTGQNLYVSLYKTMLFLNRFHTFTHGKVVSEDEFFDLITGKCSVNILSHRLNDYRWEDLLDLNLEPTEIAKRKQYYGDDFIEAQNIIKSKVSKDDYDFMNYV